MFAQLFTALLALSTVSATPVVQGSSSGPINTLINRGVGGNVPKVVIYTDSYVGGDTGLPSAQDLKGFNVLILAFLMTNGAQDQAAQWAQLSDSQRKQVLSSYKTAGITLMTSSFGSTDAPTSNGVDATAQGQKDAAWVKKFGLAGIDVDYEDMAAMNKQDGKAEQWLIDYTTALRKALPSSQGYFITHAPVAPWFSAAAYKSGAYVTVHKKVGNDIDWYNMQFYNQGSSEYTSCNGLIKQSSNAFPDTAVLQINAKAGVPFEKIVIGKPSSAGEATNGFISSSMFAQCINQAGQNGWSGGAMFWEYEPKMNGLSLINPLIDAFKLIADVGGLLTGGSTSTTSGGSDGGDDDGSSVGSSGSTTSSSKVPTASSSAKPTSTKKGSHPASSTSASAPSSTAGSDNGSDGGDDSSSSDSGSDSGSSSCSGAKAWSNDAVYDGGSDASGSSHTVSYNGWLYQNKWWTQGEKPSENSGGDGQVWTKLSACGSSSKRAFVATQVGSTAPVANISRRSHSQHRRMRRVRSAPLAREFSS